MLISTRSIEKSYPVGVGRTYVLRRVNVDIKEGEFVSIMGPSGAGKSTLLHILGMHDSAWTGEYYFMDQPVHRLNPKQRSELHKKHIGFVFQSYHLLDNLTVYENLEIPLSYRNVSRKDRQSMVARHPGPVPDRREEGSLSEPAVGRPAAAGRRRARGDRQPAGHPRRRADRQPPLGARQRNHGAVPHR